MDKAFEFSFNWIFSIIVGATIIFLAIYAANSFIKTERIAADTESVQQLESLLNPLQTSIESISKPSSLVFPKETKIFTECTTDALLGSQQIQLSSRQGIGKPWSSISFSNKIQSYLFMENPMQGKNFSLLIAPFSMPYKIADLVVLWNENYCFVNSPTEVSDEISILNGSGIFLTETRIQCPKGSKEVCFLNSASDIDEGCDIRVNSYIKQVRGNNKVVYYENSLLYPAIFSSPEIYECNVKRLVAKNKALANIYAEKSLLLGSSGCGVALEPELRTYSEILEINSSRELSNIKLQADTLENSQEDLLCALWK